MSDKIKGGIENKFNSYNYANKHYHIFLEGLEWTMGSS